MYTSEQTHFLESDQMTTLSKAVVRVGVGCFVESSAMKGAVLFGRRRNTHGSGQFALPGGHLEIGESFEECARRECKEETNLDIENIRFVHVTNSFNMGGDPLKHYVTIFMRATLSSTSSPLQNVEPHKCDGWEWVRWSDIVDMRTKNPELLFDPMIHLIDGLPNPKDLF